MTVHLIKLCVGVETVKELADWQGERLKRLKREKKTPEHCHRTLQTPRHCHHARHRSGHTQPVPMGHCCRQSASRL